MLTQEFWKNLRNKSLFANRVGNNNCCFWCIEADYDLRRFDSKHEFKQFEIRRTENPWLKQLNLDFHQWLEYRTNDLRFIVDGTAGQIDPSFSEGYYGNILRASDKLKRLYHGIVLPVEYSLKTLI